jgi:hypothetical protein
MATLKRAGLGHLAARARYDMDFTKGARAAMSAIEGTAESVVLPGPFATGHDLPEVLLVKMSAPRRKERFVLGDRPSGVGPPETLWPVRRPAVASLAAVTWSVVIHFAIHLIAAASWQPAK